MIAKVREDKATNKGPTVPSGGATPLTDNQMEYVWSTYEDAVKNGLVHEWLRYFAGGIWTNKMTPSEAAYAAAVEWDF